MDVIRTDWIEGHKIRFCFRDEQVVVEQACENLQSWRKIKSSFEGFCLDSEAKRQAVKYWVVHDTLSLQSDYVCNEPMQPSGSIDERTRKIICSIRGLFHEKVSVLADKPFSCFFEDCMYEDNEHVYAELENMLPVFDDVQFVGPFTKKLPRNFLRMCIPSIPKENLRVVCLRDQDLDAKRMLWIYPILRGSRLEELDLSRNQITGEIVCNLANSVPETLVKLNLRENRIGDGGQLWLKDCKLLAECIHKGNIEIDLDGTWSLKPLLKHVKELDISYNRITHEGAVQLAEGLADPANSLSILAMKGNRIGEEGLRIILDALKTSRVIDLNIECRGNVPDGLWATQVLRFGDKYGCSEKQQEVQEKLKYQFGQIWDCRTGDTVGCELGKKPKRPCVILDRIANQKEGMVTVALCTGTAGDRKLSIERGAHSKLTKETFVDFDNIRSVAKERLFGGGPIDHVAPELFDELVRRARERFG